MTIYKYDKLKGLIYTEKSNSQTGYGKYCFKADKSLNKRDIVPIIKKIFNVDVEKINVINVKPRSKKFKGIVGKIGPYKKMVVTLRSGQSINFA
jgi:large subunit ribosomal protein L23